MNEQVQKELKSIFNGRFSLSESTRANYARGEDTYDPVLSQAVVFPETNDEVSKILKLCNDHKIPVVPFGTGTSLEGNVVGNENGITISLEKMNKVLSVNASDFDCRVQANVTRKQLNEYLREDGVFFLLIQVQMLHWVEWLLLQHLVRWQLSMEQCEQWYQA